MTRRSRLLVLEGPDGVGKTTLAEALTSELQRQGEPARCMSFPGRELGTLGEWIYRLHHDPIGVVGGEVTPAALQTLHVAAHLDAIESRILPELEAGRTVVLDRYWWSTWVYGVVEGVPRHLLLAMIALERQVWGEVRPAMVFLIERAKPWRHERDTSRSRALVEVYESLADGESAAHPVESVENDRPAEQVVEDLVSILAGLPLTPEPVSPTQGVKHSRGTPKAKAHGGSQLPIALASRRRSLPATQPKEEFRSLAPAVPTPVFDTFWRFAAERQAIFFRRLAGLPPPWTDDPILGRYKFTNAYRAADRVSQYLIRQVIYRGDQRPEEVFFRTILFKLFNRIDTWELLEGSLGSITSNDFSSERYGAILAKAMSRGQRIYSPAYIMPTADRVGGWKHVGHLQLLWHMMRDELPLRLQDTRSLREAFELMRSYPMMGDFLAYQYVTDLNYGILLNFSEMEFVMPGPGARSGIRKCFRDRGGLSEADLIRVVTERQEAEFAVRGVNFQSLWGRPLQLVDCQNLFCEVDKYSRVAHPEVKDSAGRERIKQVFRPNSTPIGIWFPPKWGLNDRVELDRRGNDASIHSTHR